MTESDDLIARAHRYLVLADQKASPHEPTGERDLITALANALGRAGKYIEALEFAEPSCNGPHDNQGCYECRLRSESLKHIRKTGDAYHGGSGSDR